MAISNVELDHEATLVSDRKQPIVDRSITHERQSIEISKAERDANALSPSNRALAGLLLMYRGYVVLKNALDPEYVTLLGREMSDIVDDCQETLDAAETVGSAIRLEFRVSRRKRATFWFRKSRWRIFPRLRAPLDDPRLLANPFVAPVLGDVLGDGFYCRFVSSDTCTSGSILQSPHADIDARDVIARNQFRPRSYAVNVPVMECGLHNGPLEIWPCGSHLWSSAMLKPYGLSPDVQDGRNPAVERVAEYFSSIKLVLEPGTILIRDLGLWHRGTPNPTDKPRTMLTIGYFRRDRPYHYGDPCYNLDTAAFLALDPRVRALFRCHFDPSLGQLLRSKAEALAMRLFANNQ